MTAAEYRERIRVLESLVDSLACKLATVSEHLSVLAERKEVRRTRTRRTKSVCTACDGDGLSTGSPECRPCHRCGGKGVT